MHSSQKPKAKVLFSRLQAESQKLKLYHLAFKPCHKSELCCEKITNRVDAPSLATLRDSSNSNLDKKSKFRFFGSNLVSNERE